MATQRSSPPWDAAPDKIYLTHAGKGLQYFPVENIMVNSLFFLKDTCLTPLIKLITVRSRGWDMLLTAWGGQWWGCRPLNITLTQCWAALRPQTSYRSSLNFGFLTFYLWLTQLSWGLRATLAYQVLSSVPGPKWMFKKHGWSHDGLLSFLPSLQQLCINDELCVGHYSQHWESSRKQYR